MQLGGHNSVHGTIHHTTEGENLPEKGQWQVFTKSDVVNFIRSIDFSNISVPRRYTSSLDEESTEPFITAFFTALVSKAVLSPRLQSHPKKLLIYPILKVLQKKELKRISLLQISSRKRRLNLQYLLSLKSPRPLLLCRPPCSNMWTTSIWISQKLNCTSSSIQSAALLVYFVYLVIS